MDLGQVTIESIKPYVGTTFEVALTDGQSVQLKLDEALTYDLPQRRQRAKAKREPFSLYFVGDPGVILPQAMYTLRSEALTLENLFIVPVANDGEVTEYEAIFT